ncbi:MAG TPA: NUDIX pyrophosphatase [Thermodesulfobacteriaceae bacterium]|nr:NUDIX pyrophosphatase [Thermodesulfobacteriaceae bacterium]
MVPLKCRGLPAREVVTSFLRHEGKILLVKRSSRVGSFQGYWSGISGYLEGPVPLLQVLREIREETGLSGESVRLISTGKPLEIPDPDHGVCWVVHPFLLEVDNPEDICLDWENTEFRWVEPGKINDFKTVPALAGALKACMTGLNEN